jgi:hypothetical protein
VREITQIGAKRGVMSERQWKRLAWGIIVLLVLFAFLALSRRAGAACMTQREARIAYPGQWLKYRTENRCWYATSDRTIRRTAYVKRAAPLPVQSAPTMEAVRFLPWEIRIGIPTQPPEETPK